ncbi:hypothetical protein EV586_10886 [Tumebacillus sp. BK434]|uniref:hypothetical protein n=1 Tax=Tumebacillus sp. BK434 TaxID=2512169 RepID=UPI00104DA0B9|nr:hypothetical protein [Tumebacillus sp. BK434]TCP52711.1 hypothetical protein EV586_10886 [Tumebacillus sp. BK434]
MKKQAVAVLMSVALISTFSTTAAFAKEADRKVGSYSQPTKVVQPEDSFVVYEANGYVSGSTYGTPSYVDLKYYLNHRADISVPSGVTATYEFSQTVTSTSYRQHTVDAGVKASGSIAVVDIEGHIKYTYQNSTTMTYTKGTKSNINVSAPGSYTVYWYNEAQVYTLYCKWWGYTVDAPNTRKQITRIAGEVREPKQWENIDVVKR